MHRPISITHSLPRSISDEAFSEIFAARAAAAAASAAKQNPSDVLSTLSRAVDDLEGPLSKMSISRAEAEDDQQQQADGVQKIDLRHADGRESSLSVQVKSMTGQFLPFQPPPIPSPGSASAVPADADDAEPHHRVYRAMFTIEESLDADGQVQVLAHSPRILGDGDGSAPARYIDRVRRARQEDALWRRANGESMHAISVKKRRKLKMKKKKFKKKLKGSRKLRERLNKL
ncbi:AURKAIP1/COX24 domain-containing protein, partial [Candidatus Bathyarchaeota archaeon]|nr:AURKAIP1/COX24 domain-containing protein [Candidatus Bathyarchaeota archaeon]